MAERIPLSGSDVRTLRTYLGLSQAAFAALLEVHKSQVSRWERRGPPPRGPARILLEQLWRRTFPDWSKFNRT